MVSENAPRDLYFFFHCALQSLQWPIRYIICNPKNIPAEALFINNWGFFKMYFYLRH